MGDGRLDGYALMLIWEKLLYVSPWFLVCHVVTHMHNGFGQCCGS